MKVFGLIIKLLVLVAIIMLGAFLYLTCSGSSCLVQRIDKMPPDTARSPWEVRTPTHIYYAESAIKADSGDVTISGWYELVKDKWIYHKETLRLPVDVYGEITSRRR